MQRTKCWAIAASLALTFAAGAASAAPERVALDTEVTVGGVGVGCTGIGETKNQPRWAAYPVRLEFADEKRNYLAGEEVSVSDAKGGQLLDVVCEGPWVLLKLPAGKSFKAVAQLAPSNGESHSAVVKAPSHGQARFVFTFKATD